MFCEAHVRREAQPSDFRSSPHGQESLTGGVIAIGRNRVRFDFNFEGVRYRPSLPVVPRDANLRRARQHLAEIKQRIAFGTFCFADEFPDFRNLMEVPGATCPRTCTDVFDAFLAEGRLARSDLATITVASH